ncbi:hypothetical protein CAL7102_05601 [Dulcicalothrix desertica PCC 7102]|nr:hypothetical protein CAL7102_05601 [Dulcicalothrix desertica PCC 7102]
MSTVIQPRPELDFGKLWGSFCQWITMPVS